MWVLWVHLHLDSFREDTNQVLPYFNICIFSRKHVYYKRKCRFSFQRYSCVILPISSLLSWLYLSLCARPILPSFKKMPTGFSGASIVAYLVATSRLARGNAEVNHRNSTERVILLFSLLSSPFLVRWGVEHIFLQFLSDVNEMWTFNSWNNSECWKRTYNSAVRATVRVHSSRRFLFLSEWYLSHFYGGTSKHLSRLRCCGISAFTPFVSVHRKKTLVQHWKKK